VNFCNLSHKATLITLVKVAYLFDKVCNSLTHWEYATKQFNIPNSQIIELKKYITQ